MNSDKIDELLEEHLKVLRQPVRREILKKLGLFDKPITFSSLQKEVLGSTLNSANFSFHLKELKKVDYIDNLTEGYMITELGREFLNYVLSMEQLLNEQNRTIMIRTSKYSKEPFNIKKIEEFLIREGEMEAYLAKTIAEEVENRLSKTNIDYLTAPLLREYINAILIENGLELVRKKLTRLGTPPFEVFKLFETSSGVKINPRKFIQTLGSDVSEQFLLLNLLPSDLADMYLSGEIVLLNLDYWGLRPLGIYLKTDTIMDIVSQKTKLNSKQLANPLDFVKYTLEFNDILQKFKPFFSQDILLGGFNTNFLTMLNQFNPKESPKLIDLLVNRLLRYNRPYDKVNPFLSYSFNYTNGHSFENDLVTLSSFNTQLKKCKYQTFPFISLDYSIFNKPNFDFKSFRNSVEGDLLDKIIFYNPKTNLINSSLIKIPNADENRIILDKIMINLPILAMHANQNDDFFFEILEDRVRSIFKLFQYKEEFVNKKLNNLSSWRKINSSIGDGNNNLLADSIKSVSFFGLNKAVKIHCGIELDRLKTSMAFALKSIMLINDIIKEENDRTNSLYDLSQTHYDLFDKSLDSYSPRIIRKDCNISFEERISLFQRFEKIISGGIIFNGCFDSNDLSIDETLNILSQADLPAFTLKNSIF